MTMHPLLRRWQGRLRRREMADLLVWAPLMLAAMVFLVSRFAPARFVIGSIGLAIAVLVFLLVRAWLRIDATSAIRQLDALSPELEDSADLLLGSMAERSSLQVLQRERILARLSQHPLPAIARAPMPRFVVAIGAVLVILIFASLFPRMDEREESKPGAAATAETPVSTQTVIRSVRLAIEAPAYTGLPPRTESVLEAEVADGSRLAWQIQFEPDPKAVKLVFHDGKELALTEGEQGWHAETVLTDSTLYRIAVSGAPVLADDRLYRLDAIVDLAPEIKVVAPDKTLTQLELGQRQWPLYFEVTDDYGIGDAKLAITLAQGGGEQVTVSERSERLRADAGGDARQRRYRRHLDLGSLGFAEGDDLIVRLIVTDNRRPGANEARSAGYILRWPVDLSRESEGVDGIVQKVLPAYFRSQRQIIIDTEALIGERAQLADDRFMARSDTIGVDQKILRLRYGQFLGEEFESGDRKPHSPGDAHDDAPTQQDALSADHDHEQGADSATGFGKADNILAEFGHTHDHAEAATLLDPATKKTLKAALAEMWQAELHLRQGEPAKALPYENRALDLIKQVQQSTRIYLARVGLELPPVDESRRLSGERKGVTDTRGVLVEAEDDLKVISETYQTLADGSSGDLEAFSSWLRAPSTALPDTLGLIAAVDALRRQPDCASCRSNLLDRLWAVLPNPPTVSRSRGTPDASGRRYLERLQQEPPA
ncbi:MAG: DUF4175 family protein [Xanthomonadales bacterium]|nr:DUF4175 family protein [Xanthomonadales bacterium]